MGVNIVLGANVMLLGARLSAAYAKVGNGYKILIKPTNVEENEGIYITKMVEDVNALIASITGDNKPAAITAKDVEDKLPADKKDPETGWKSLKIKLSMIYLYIESDGGNTSKVMEFAFKLDIDSSKLIPADITLVRIDSLSIAVWNTENTAVTDKMQLTLPAAMGSGS